MSFFPLPCSLFFLRVFLSSSINLLYVVFSFAAGVGNSPPPSTIQLTKPSKSVKNYQQERRGESRWCGLQISPAESISLVSIFFTPLYLLSKAIGLGGDKY